MTKTSDTLDEFMQAYVSLGGNMKRVNGDRIRNVFDCTQHWLAACREYNAANAAVPECFRAELGYRFLAGLFQQTDPGARAVRIESMDVNRLGVYVERKVGEVE